LEFSGDIMATAQEERAGANLSFWEATDEEAALHPLRKNKSDPFERWNCAV
jgi:hypothetical protein